MESLIERQLRNSDQALGNRAPRRWARAAASRTYDLDMLNVETPLRDAAHRRRRSRRAATARCASTARPAPARRRWPSTSPSSLDKPLLIKQASDLMSKFVGETEQNMAAMFREAENEKAVLLLDEADSFLQDRRGAQRTYEVTEVNEMLQGMERFNGIFVCTTNLMDRIDQAALRRFTFKIRFKPLTAAAAREDVRHRGAGRRCARCSPTELTSAAGEARPAVPGRLCGRQAPGRHPGGGVQRRRVPGAARGRAPHQARGARGAQHRLPAVRRYGSAATTRSTSAP